MLLCSLSFLARSLDLSASILASIFTKARSDDAPPSFGVSLQNLFVRLFVCSFVRSFVCLFVRSFVCLFVCLFVCSFVVES